MSASGSGTLPPSDPRAGKEALVHFMSAFAFLLVGLAALFWNSERLSQGAFGDPRVLGGLHFLTLGWLTLSIFGAVRVFTGVALGSQGSKLDLAPWVRRLWILGALLFPFGLIVSAPWLIIPGVLLIGAALALYTAHLVPALIHATRGGVTRWYLVIALGSIWCAWLLGGVAAFMRAGQPLGWLPSGYLQAHLLLAVFGWVGATVAGVGSHLIPMFALSREPRQWPVKAALPVWCALPVFALLGAFGPEPYLRLAWGAAFVGSALWIAQVIMYFRTRLRREPDPGLLLAAGATALLGIAWIVELFAGAPIAFVGLLVVGWLTLFTLGIYHRVVPFLVWYARFARGAGRGPVIKVKDLINERLGHVTAVSCLIGALIWASGLRSASSALAYLGSALIFLGAASALGQVRWLVGWQAKPSTNTGPRRDWAASGASVLNGGSAR
jgi:hypothetical protein